MDDETLFEFYDQRISHDVISARHFDSWWKRASRETPDLLNFEKSMLIKEGAEQVSKLDYPNFWHQGNLKLRLSYQFERRRRRWRDGAYSAAAAQPDRGSRV